MVWNLVLIRSMLFLDVEEALYLYQIDHALSDLKLIFYIFFHELYV